MNQDFRVLMIAPESRLEDLGISSITSVLREHGYPVELRSLFKGRENYKDIARSKPSLIGITAYQKYLKYVFEISRELRARIPGAYICVGGYAPTYHARTILEQAPAIDFAIRGEGEMPFLELARRLREKSDVGGIRGLVYRDGDSIVANDTEPLIQDLDGLPYVSRDQLARAPHRFALVITSRGCTQPCTFCSGKNFWQDNQRAVWRGRSPRDVVDEIEQLHTRSGIRSVWFVDGSFEDPGFNEERMRGLAQEIVGRGLVVSYSAFCRAGFWRKASPELMQLLKASGLCSVFLGIESANDYDLRVLGKAATAQDNLKALAFFEQHGIYSAIGFINFHPYSTLPNLRRNADFLEEHRFARFLRHITFAKLYKGDKLYEAVRRDGLLEEQAARDFDEFAYRYVDEKVARLAAFLKAHFWGRKIARNMNMVDIMFMVEHYYGDRLAHFRRHLALRGEAELVDRHRQRLDLALDDFNVRVSTCFRQLLDLAEGTWDSAAAARLAKGLLPRLYFARILKDLWLEQRRFFKAVSKTKMSLDVLKPWTRLSLWDYD